MSPGATFERVYLALKEELTGGRWPPGERLEPALLSANLNASITPVRDALHRLAGERLVEAPRQNGFRVPLLTEQQLRHLYDWNEALLDLALRAVARGVRNAAGDVPPIKAGAGAPELFRDIVRQAGNPEQLAALRSLNDRLAAMRLVENRLLADVGEEAAALRSAWAAPDLTALRRAIHNYHRRRRNCVPRLVAAAREGPAAGG
jgi:DNA-binding FadR family transcriptional regulator